MTLTQKATRVTFTGTSAPTVTFATQNCASGSTLIAIGQWEQPLASCNSMADGTNGSYTMLTAGNSGNNGSGGDGGVRIGYFINNASTGKPTVTVTFSSGVDGVINCYEIPASTFDQQANGGGASSAPSITVNSVGANAFILAGTHRRFGGATADTATFTATADFLDLNINSGQHSIEYVNDAGSSGNKQIDFTDTTSQPAWASAAASFVAAGGGGGSPQLQPWQQQGAMGTMVAM